MSASEFALKFLSHLLEKRRASRSIVLDRKTGNNHRSKKQLLWIKIKPPAEAA
jgi:hypothetical protein